MEKELTKLIPKMYKWNCENMGLFFFCKGQLQIFPTLRIEQVVMNYFRFIDISLDEWDVDSAVATYGRMQNEFYKGIKCNESTPANK